MSETQCLGIAVDHRIKLLFTPVDLKSSDTERGTHKHVLRELGKQCYAGKNEIEVTTGLAGPSSTGGIAVSLQQPREYHPFEEGVDAVIADCDTLAALREVFTVVSCGTLRFEQDISTIDLLPYTSEDQADQMTDEEKAHVFRGCVQAFCSKEPDVILCAGKIWLKDAKVIKGEAWKLESRAVGQTFGDYRVIRLRCPKSDKLVKICRVNAFHPSYAIHFNRDVSQLRQLLILAVAEACGRYNKTWKEEFWMESFRASCSKLSINLAESLCPIDDPASFCWLMWLLGQSNW